MAYELYLTDPQMQTVISGPRWSACDWYKLLSRVGCVGGDFSQTTDNVKT